jgi:hypothetical protein
MQQQMSLLGQLADALVRGWVDDARRLLMGANILALSAGFRMGNGVSHAKVHSSKISC